MTRRDFELIAGAIRNGTTWSGTDTVTAGRIITSLADALQATHPRFDRERFIAAAGPEEPR